jgi:hypothetical protein
VRPWFFRCRNARQSTALSRKAILSSMVQSKGFYPAVRYNGRNWDGH